jgi:crossover junction endodeoxyribonuclease RusA
VQRPNAVIRNGGPRLLQGLMLPLPPSSNAYWRNVLLPSKGMKFPFYATDMRVVYSKFRVAKVPTEEAKAYCKLIAELALQKNFRFFTDKPLRMDVVVCPRDRREIDAHNYTKVLFDALEQAGVYVNDSQVIDSRTRVGPIIKGGRVCISLWETQADPDAVLKEAWH